MVFGIDKTKSIFYINGINEKTTKKTGESNYDKETN